MRPVTWIKVVCVCICLVHVVKAQTDTLQNVQVNAQRLEWQSDPSKKVFYVGTNLVNLGGNLFDVLSQIPSIYVTADGLVQYRGNQNMQIYFDGKPSGILSSSRANALSLFPADRIDKIEIISAPGAKYPAEGSSGILNIILKKGRDQDQIQGNVNLGTSQQVNASAGYAIARKKWTHGWDYSYRQSIRNNYQLFYRENASQFGLAQINQETKEINRDYNQLFTWNTEYAFDKNHALALNVVGRISSDAIQETRFNESRYARAPDRFYIRDADKRGNDSGIDVGLSYHHQVPNRWDGSLNLLWITNSGEDANQFNQNYFFDGFDVPNSNVIPRIEESKAQSMNQTLLAQGDWKRILSPKKSIEFGFRFQARQFESDFLYAKFLQNTWNIDSKRSNAFRYQEAVQAVYVQANFQALTIGLRAEATQAQKQSYVNVFPSLMWTKSLSKNAHAFVNLSTRINRPNYKALNPFISFADPLNLNAGNPNLLPEKTLLGELGYAFDKNSWSFSNQFFYRDIQGLVGRIRTFLDGDTTLTRFENIASSRAIGFEQMTQGSILKGWQVTWTSSIFQNDVQGDINGTLINEKRWTWNSRLNQQFAFGKWSGQISGIYHSAQINPLGIIQAYYTVDLGFKRELNKGKVTINARVNDVLNTQQTVYDTRPFGFVSDLTKKKETRIYYVGVSFKLVSKKIKFGKKRKAINEDEAGDEED